MTPTTTDTLASGARQFALALILLVYLHNTLPYLTMMPKVNVDEPWLMERAYQVMKTGVPNQPMYGLDHAYLLQPGYGYLVAPWLAAFGVGIFQARLLGVVLGLGIVLAVVRLGRLLVGPAAGLWAALFLATDSNFLGGVRNTRTDIPSVFFIALALVAFQQARRTTTPWWYFLSGAAVGLGMLCHGNTYWIALILLAWYAMDTGRQLFTERAGYLFLAGLLTTFGPYVAVLGTHWQEFNQQLANFAGDRVPRLNVAFVLGQVAREPLRYRNWYFGLITNTVPNPLLWVFQAATVAGLLYLIVGIARGAYRLNDERARGYVSLAVLALGGVAIFAGFINNKAHVYLPHLLLGFSLAAGLLVGDVVSAASIAVSRLLQRSARVTIPLSALLLTPLCAYGAVSAAYYEKWYASAKKSELLPYELTAATAQQLLPAGPMCLLAAPEFWVPFAQRDDVTFVSYAAAEPHHDPSGDATIGVPTHGRPVYLLIDESQWKHDLTASGGEMSAAWQHDWIRYITEHCAIYGVAPGTAYGTLASYRCWDRGRGAIDHPLLLGKSARFELGPAVLTQTGAELARWPVHVDPRRSRGLAPPSITTRGDALHISGEQWPGVSTYLPVTPGSHYLVDIDFSGTHPGDLLYIGRWERPEVTSLAGNSAAGMPMTLERHDWFPLALAFTAVADRVRLLLYSEAPSTDFLVPGLSVRELMPSTRLPVVLDPSH